MTAESPRTWVTAKDLAITDTFTGIPPHGGDMRELTPEMLWAGARGFDLKAPHWDDLKPEIRDAVSHIVQQCRLVDGVVAQGEAVAWMVVDRDGNADCEPSYREHEADGDAEYKNNDAAWMDRGPWVTLPLYFHPASATEGEAVAWRVENIRSRQRYFTDSADLLPKGTHSVLYTVTPLCESIGRRTSDV